MLQKEGELRGGIFFNGWKNFLRVSLFPSLAGEWGAQDPHVSWCN